MFFFFNDTATTEIYTLSLHDALPISATLIADSFVTRILSADEGGQTVARGVEWRDNKTGEVLSEEARVVVMAGRSEEHTSELQSRQYLVCRLLLEKKKRTWYFFIHEC